MSVTVKDTDSNKTKQKATTNTAGIASVKLLNEQIKAGGRIHSLIAKVKDARKNMEAVIAKLKEKRESLRSNNQNQAKQSATHAQSTVEVVEKKTVHVQSQHQKHVNPQKSAQLGKPKILASIVTKKSLDSSSTQTVARPSYIRGNYTPPVTSRSAVGSMQSTRERSFGTQKAKPSVIGNMGVSKGTGKFDAHSTKQNTKNQQNVRTNSTPRPNIVSSTVKDTRTKSAVDHKKKEYKTNDSSKMSKRTLIRKGFITLDMDDTRMGTRKLKNRKIKDAVKFAPIKIEKAVITTENLTVKILSEKIGKTAQEIIKQLMVLGIMCNINSVVDFATMELVANELGVELELKLDKTNEEKLVEYHKDIDDTEEQLFKRPPVVAVMGHVDHGKTSLLDAIRKTNVMSGEAGGITQHIGAYTVKTHGENITFLDTPGHEAFTHMRARGAKVTDIAILVVAADDGVMPQTIEAIDHIKAANVPMIVAINKMDKSGANPAKVKEMLSAHGVVSEEWGGDTMMVPVAAKKGEGIEKLLENILFLSEYQNFRANPQRSARGSVIEAKMDKGKGPMATIIVQNGSLKLGDVVVSGRTYGKIRGMVDWTGTKVKFAGPSTAVSVLGFNDVPNAGDGIFVVEDEKLAKQVVSEREDKIKLQQVVVGHKVSLDDVFDRITQSQLKDLNIIIKADVQGSAEALHASLSKLSNDEVKVKVVHSGVGAISKSDIMLAEVSNAIIVGFNIKPDSESKIMAERSNIDIRLYKVIYEAIDDVTRAIKGLQKPVYKDTSIGRMQVRHIFKLSSHGVVAGCYVLSGKVVRNSKAWVWRGKERIYDGKISSLKRFKEDVKEVGINYECGIVIDGFDLYKLDDEIEVYIQEQINK
ncbi:MAG: translation initiation factor IF-2 [Clostridiales bacterium]|nr:translation initiation factor IF-2 [Clostridiales bacterium]